MGFTGSVDDRLLIRELLGSYSDAVMRRDAEDYLACWHDAGVRTGAGGDCSGKAELRTQWNGIWQVVDRMAFLTEIASIEVTGDAATARCYCHETLRLVGGDTRRLLGRYDDVLTRADGRWVFARREYTILIDNC